MKIIILVISSLIGSLLFVPAARAQSIEEIRCIQGTPPSYYDQIKFTEIFYRLEWVGNQMEGYFRGSMELKGADFPQGNESIKAKAMPHYSEFGVWGEGSLGKYLIKTYWNGVDKKVGDTYLGEFRIENKEGWQKSIQLICTKTH